MKGRNFGSSQLQAYLFVRWKCGNSSPQRFDNRWKIGRTPPLRSTLRLILVSGKTEEFLFSPNDSAGEIAQFVFDNWPEAIQILKSSSALKYSSHNLEQSSALQNHSSFST
uniref:Ubiquitin-like protein 3 n=1 Tax=Lygus hesperus TaxID=30085 RepID=A0A0A9XBQ3_LYGHE